MPLKISLKRLLLINLILASIIPLIILFSFSNIWVKKDISEEVKVKNDIIGKLVLNHIRDYLDFFTSILNSILERVESKDINEYIQKIQKDIRQINQIIITDENGRILYTAPYDNDLIGIDLSKKEYFVNATKGKEYFSNVDINIATGEPSVYISKKKEKTLIINLDLKELKKIFCNNEIEYFITDKNNTILFSTDEEDVLQRKNVWFIKNKEEPFSIETYFKEKEFITTYIPLKKMSWGLTVLYEKEKALLPVERISRSLLYILVVVIIFSIIISALIAKKILRPLEHIRNKINYIATGNYTTDISLNGIIELNGVIYDVKNMSETIKEREEELEYLKTKYEKIMNTVPVAVMLVRENGEIVEWNDYSEKLFGFKREEVLGKKSPIIPEELREETDKLRKEIIKGRTIINYETKRKTKWGDEKYLLGFYSAIKIAEEIDIVIAYIDITEKRILEEKLKNSLEESQALLKEIHHRIKNNLQIISGLLYLQSIFIEDKIAISALNESQKRIKTMMLIHDMLYKTRKLSHIEMDVYIKKLVKTFFEEMISKDYDIKHELDLDRIVLPSEKASNCGLIINEVINNSIKYAFPKNKGKIQIKLKDNKGKILLEISDNGQGFNKEEHRKGIGLELINTLVKSLDGTIQINTEKGKGTKFIIEFSY